MGNSQTTARSTLFTLLFLLLSAVPLRAQAGVFLSEREAVKEVFPDAASVAQESFRPTTQERSAMEAGLQRELTESAYPVLLIYDASRRFLGYAMVTEERGKYRPITFLVGITPQMRVKDTAVMVYRESRGGQVRSPRFLNQYRGKTLDDPIRTNRDIINISGATISVHSMNAGVRKALMVVQTVYGTSPPRLAAAELKPLGSLR
ncbi:MAG TPA: FMN-binding protein [Longimicrobiaceae bacterium]|nr:FMN-binding protein [Longimicrobiaceae bacterium]